MLPSYLAQLFLHLVVVWSLTTDMASRADVGGEKSRLRTSLPEWARMIAVDDEQLRQKLKPGRI